MTLTKTENIMETQTLFNRIVMHTDSNRGRAAKKAYEFIKDKSTVFFGISMFRGIGLNVTMLNHKSVVIENIKEEKGGFVYPAISVTVLTK